MFIRRCGWHRRYHGHGKLLGISAWHRWTVTFSDGMCERCAVRAREEWGLPKIAIDAEPESWLRSQWRAFPFATVAVAASVVIVVFGLMSREHASVTGVPGGGTGIAASGDLPESTSQTRQNDRAVAQAEAPARPAGAERTEIASAPDASRVAARPSPRRARVTRVSARGDSVAPGEYPDVVPTSAPDTEPSRILPAAAPAAAPLLDVTPIDVRTLHPFSAPRIVEHQAP